MAAGAQHTNDAAPPSHPLVNAGKATCCGCNEPIHAGDEWHLDHNDARDDYLGVSHASCNLRDGANKTNGKRPPPPPERPYKWSQRWYDDPPIGTIVLGNERHLHGQRSVAAAG